MLVTSELPEPIDIKAGAPTDGTELLRQILAEQQHRDIAYKEAREIGDTLLDFYQVLAEEVDYEPTE